MPITGFVFATVLDVGNGERARMTGVKRSQVLTSNFIEERAQEIQTQARCIMDHD